MNITLFFLTFSLSILVSIITIKAHAQNIIKNANFETINDTQVEYWRFDGWQINPDITTYQVTSGKNAQLMISSSENTHAYMLQDVWLDQNSSYIFTADIKSLDIPTVNTGASISLHTHHVKGCNIQGSKDWSQCQLQISNNGPRKKVALMLSLGHYGNLNQGQAFFKNISLEKKHNTLPNITTITFGKNQKHLKKSYFIPPQDVYLNIGLAVLMISLFISLFVLIKKTPKNS